MNSNQTYMEMNLVIDKFTVLIIYNTCGSKIIDIKVFFGEFDMTKLIWSSMSKYLNTDCRFKS